MGRKHIEEQLSEISFDNVPEGPGFKTVPPPEMDANAMARAVTAAGDAPIGPVALPEENRATPAQPIHQHPMEGPRVLQPIAEMIDEFIAKIQAHPDAHLLSSAFAGPADESEAQTFPDAPVRSLRVDTFRIIRRTTAEVAPAPAKNGERQRWQEAVIAGHVDEMRKAQEAAARSRQSRQAPAIDPATIAAIVAATVQALEAKKEPQAASA